MLAETVIAALAATAALYQGQRIYGRRYERDTARLRERSRAFYAAADALLTNPRLDARHLGLLKVMSESIDEPMSARRWAKGLREICKRRRRKLPPKPLPAGVESPDRTLMKAFAVMTEAGLLLIAERSIIWGPSIRNSVREINAATSNSHDREASMFETVFDDRMMSAA